MLLASVKAHSDDESTRLILGGNSDIDSVELRSLLWRNPAPIGIEVDWTFFGPFLMPIESPLKGRRKSRNETLRRLSSSLGFEKRLAAGMSSLPLNDVASAYVQVRSVDHSRIK